MLLLLGVWQVTSASYMWTKAWLSQVLIAHAWDKTLDNKQYHKPWSWADGYPIAMLSVPRLNKNRYILSGSSGRNLAFSAAHMPQSGLPGEAKSIVIAGHNDSHFAFLPELTIGDEVILNGLINGQKVTEYYVIKNISIIDSRNENISVINNNELILVTCYPFDGLSLATTDRYVVKAIPKEAKVMSDS